MDFDSRSDSENEIQIIKSVVVSAAAFLEYLALSRKQKRKNPSIWVTPYLKERQTKRRFVTDVIFFPSLKINVL